ncbi:MAG: UDP-N-acetylmuramoyl-tripeptide--D-alanyl-D-alanine ligase [Dehalococcoidia bacterium]|nr:UDP-N-acetylmuramoyl-tripeptide--D-alanyl-D-alanine ligase [Dehalococcoidia bacterium]
MSGGSTATPGVMLVPAPDTALDTAFATRALGAALRGRRGPERAFARAVVDSRLVRPGDLFVALPGERVDGHQFAADAAAAGAVALLLAHEVRGVPEDCAQLYVDDTLAALQRLAAAWLVALPATRVVGVTGNVGKTTTKLMLAAVLASKYRVQATDRNYNNEIGVPLCLLELRPQTERAVIELGMYTTGEIALLCRWARPHTGVVLNVGPVHLERAGSLEAIAHAKRELVEALPPEGHAILNADDPAVRAMAAHSRAPVTLFGTVAGADVRAFEVASHGATGFEFTLLAAGESRRVRVPLPGAHLLSNVLAAAATALADGLTLDAVTAALERLDVPLRLRVRALPGGVTLLDDTYNASPASTRAALDLLAETPGRRVALLGDMRELGALSAQSHAAIGRRAAEVVDALYTVGELARGIADAARAAGLREARHLKTKAEAEAALRATLRAGDALLVKGSRALALETVVEALERSAGRQERWAP